MHNADTRNASGAELLNSTGNELADGLRNDLRTKLRKELREKRSTLSPAQQAKAAQALIESVMALPQWSEAQTIAVYSPFDGEIGTLPLARKALSLSKRVYLPVLTDDKKLQFAPWVESTSLTENRYGILQPSEAVQRLAHHEIDIIFMPLVGWDEAGNRLGMGGGYYDRTLSGATPQSAGPLKVGLAHTCQQVTGIEQASWDVAMDFVATDSQLYCCKA